MSTYETHIWKNPQLPFIFQQMHLGVHQNFSGANWHENIELLYITSGSGTVWSDGAQIPVRANDLIALNSNCLHDISTDRDLHYYYLVVDRSFCLSNHFDTNRLLFDTVAFHDAELAVLFGKLILEYQTAEDSLFRTQAIRALVLSILVRLCRTHSHPTDEKEETHLLSCIKQAIGFIRSNIDSPDLSLDEITEFVGLSKYYFAHKFKQITGYTCVHYINMLRCEKAKALLSDHRLELGRIGQSCGFNSQSYFTRTFHAYTGCSPNTYRQNNAVSGSAVEQGSSLPAVPGAAGEKNVRLCRVRKATRG